MRPRRARALKRHEFILREAKEHGRLQRLMSLATYLRQRVYRHSEENVDRLIREMDELIQVTEGGFAREALQHEIEQLKLYADGE